MRSSWQILSVIGIVLLAAALMAAGHFATAQPEVEVPSQTAPARTEEAVGHSVDTLMADFDRTVVARAREQGGAFPASARWLDLLASAIATNMPPGQLSRNADPVARLGKGASQLLDAASAAERELRDLLPPKLPGKNLGKIAAYKQRTRPTSLTVLVLRAFYGKPAAIRAEGARQIRTHGLDRSA